MTIKKLSALMLIALMLNACGDDEGVQPTPTPMINASDATFTIAENAAVGDEIGIIQASASLDNEPQAVAFNLIDQNPAGAVSINASSGALSVADASIFDFETNNSISANVRVSAGSVADTVQVTINITDLLEFSVEDFSATIAENPAEGLVLGTITPTADMSGVAFTFDVVTESAAGAFNINDNGELSVADSTLFDFELSETVSGTFSATAAGITQSFDATITLTDKTLPRTSLVAEYRLDGDLSDMSGNGNDGNEVGTLTPANDRRNNANGALDFSSGHFTIADVLTPSNTTFTISAWVKFNTELTTLILMDNSNGPTSLESKFRIFTSGGKYELNTTVIAQSAPTGFNAVSEDAFEESTTEWTHVVFRVENTVNISLFVNGVELPNEFFNSQAALPYEASAEEFIAIGSQDNVNSPFDGLLDDILIYGRALTDEEITALANDDF
ncbi:MAG: LamG-like jellyroll fold domain-containing protein [Bacteroidota bacterium]